MPRIQHKRGTSANLASVNPTPLAGELVWDSTENAIKIGDGATAWTSLAYVTATPRKHTHSADAITSGTVAYARLPVGSTTSTVCAGDDARLSDARTPTAHKSTHATGGSDALTPADIGAATAASPAITGNATFEASSGVPVTITNTGTGNSFVVNDAAGDTTPFVVDAAGKVGVGTTPTTRAVTVRGSGVSDGAVLLQSSSTGSGTTNGFIIQCFGASSDAYVWNFENAPIIFGANNAERMRLTAAGDLGLGPSRTAPASRLDVNGVITVSAGTAAAPALVFSGDSNTGIAQIGGADSWSVVTGGTERIRVEANGDIRVGSSTAIGRVELCSPASTKGTSVAPEASGIIAFPSYNHARDLCTIQSIAREANFLAGQLAFTCANASGNSQTYFVADGQADTVSIRTAGVERLRVDSSGRVGLGTAPSHALDVASTSAVSARIRRATAGGQANLRIEDGDGSYYDLATVGNVLAFISNTSERMRIDASGRLAIGTASASSLLTVNGVITVSAGTAAAPALVASGDANTGAFFPAADTFAISTAGSERVRVEADGRMSFGAGGSGSANGIQLNRSLSGGSGVNGLISAQTVTSEVTSGANVFRTFVGTQAASFTLAALTHFRSTANTFGAGSTVTTQIGFQADNTLTGATNNYGFRGDIADGTGRWNFYGLGTAPNYFAGNVGIGSGTTSPTAALDINADKIRLRTAKTPASASDTGNAGDICWDASYLYICTATNTWRRIAHSTW